MSNIQQNLTNILQSRYGRDVRQAIHDGIHACYEDGKAGAIDLVARELIADKVSGSPAGVYANLAALIAADPDHSRIYLTTDNGHWNYWDGSAWTAGGVYQATAIITDKTMTIPGQAADAKAIGDRLSFAAAREAENTTAGQETRIKTGQLFDYQTSTQGKFFGVDGALVDNAAYSVSEFIKINRGHTVYIYRFDNHAATSLAWGFQGFDAKGTYLRTVQLATIDNKYNNIDMDYIRIAFDSTLGGLIVVEEDAQTVTSMAYYQPPLYMFSGRVHTANNCLAGKTFVALGDSITAGSGVDGESDRTWGGIIAARNGMKFINAGVSGSTMGYPISPPVVHPCWVDGRYQIIEGKDYAIIWFGWNDYNYCALGSAATPDATTFLGSYYNTLLKCVRDYPKTKIGVIIPYLWAYAADPQGYTIMSLINGLKAVCDTCGVPYLDINKCNFLQSWGSDYPNDENYYTKWNSRQAMYTSDTLHPNDDGNQYLATIIEHFMRSL